jgi:hypothetical protein
MSQLCFLRNRVFSELMWNLRSIISKLRGTAKGFVWKSFSHRRLWSSWLMNSGLFPLRQKKKLFFGRKYSGRPRNQQSSSIMKLINSLNIIHIPCSCFTYINYTQHCAWHSILVHVREGTNLVLIHSYLFTVYRYHVGNNIGYHSQGYV